MQSTAAVILAAGTSKRMITELPKVLHEVCGRPMLAYVLDACRAAGIERVIGVVGYRKEEVIEAFKEYDHVEWVEQPEQKGTGDAVMVCREALGQFQGNLVVLAGDMPLLRSQTLEMLIGKHEDEHSAATLATAVLENPNGYGRIVRDAYGNLQGIVEESDCNETQRQIREINPSYYCFDSKLLFEALEQVKPDNVKGEYYLTDALQILIRSGHRAVAVTAVRPEEAMGINSRQQLAQVSKVMQERIQLDLMSNGVTIVDPPNTWIDVRAQIGRDTVIHPFTYIHGKVEIGRRCSVGPFAYLRHGTVLGDDVVVGVFTELKNATLGKLARARHHSYIGDAHIGSKVNVGAGTIVANFDGQKISHTQVDEDAYIGSGSILVAPVHVPAGEHVDPGSIVGDRGEAKSEG
jgi:bifunctional UDP-N-acetylglucosamine pyrophosphorylase/glucosamine-1-phosphate N-acetyltransferase